MKTIEMVEMTCCNCGTQYSVEQTIYDLRKSDGATFYCPNGHGQHYTESDTSRIKKLKKELEETKKELADKEIELRQVKCELLKFRQQERGPFWTLFKKSPPPSSPSQ